MRLLQRWMDELQTGALARLLQRTGHVGFFDYQFPTNRFAWTPGLCRLFGLDAAPGGGLEHWYARMTGPDRSRVERELWTACASRRRHEALEYAVPLLTGGIRSLSSHVLLRYGADGRPLRMVGVTVDVTQRATETARRAKDELMASISHQLRTPLGALSAASSLLQAVEPGSADAQEARAVIGRQTAQLARLLHELTAACRETPGLHPAAVSDPLSPSQGRKVLVVEGNGDALASLRARLELDGHQVSTAGDGLEGLSHLLNRVPEVSIVDIGLPRLTGFEVARHARASGYAGRMIALSDLDGGKGSESDARLAGFDDCLIKPVDPGRLRASVRAD